MYFVCLVCVRVILKSNEKFVIFSKEREKERKKEKEREGQSGGLVRKKERKKKKKSLVLSMDPTILQLIYKKNHLATLLEN